jgi:hypothetical protein
MQYVLGNMLNGAGGLNPDGLSLDLQFAADKTLTARKGPTPVFTRGSTGTFVGSDGLIQSAAINAPRFDHDPVTLACRGLLIEEGRTNLVSRSSNFPAGAWTISFARLTMVLDAIGPDGALSATTLTATGVAGSAFIHSSGSITAGVTYTHSAIVKAGSSNFVGISSFDGVSDYGAMFNLDTGVFVGYRTPGGIPISNSITPLGGGWYRVSFTYVAVNTNTAFAAQIMISQAGNLNFATSCVAGTSIIVFAYQMEAGAFPSSYIPTTTGALTRSADVCSITGDDFNNFYNQSEGTLFAECQTPSANQYAGIAVIGTTSFNHNIALFKSDATGGTVGNRFVPYVTQGGSLVAIHDFGNESGNGNLKVLASVALNNMIFARNGTLSPLDSTAAMPTPNRITIGGRADGNYINGHIAAIRYYRKRLPNAKLVTLTT